MSGTANFSSGNPPPAGPLIPSSIKTQHITVGFGTTKSVWPTKVYSSTAITTTSVVDYTTTPFTYINFNVAAPIILTIRSMTIGSMFVAEITGAGSVTFRVLTNRSGGIDQFINGTGALSVGTHIITVFGDALVSTSLANPTAV